MFKSPLFLTVITCGLFFLFATATSPDEEFPDFAELNLTVEVVDTNLVIANNDTLNISNAFMQLEKPLGDSLNGVPLTELYFASGFNLNMGVSDTFPMSVFKRSDTLAYPVDTFPHSFNLDFSNSELGGFFRVVF